MFKNFIFQERTWLTLITAILITGGKCDPPKKYKGNINPASNRSTDSLNSKASDSPGVSSDSDSSGTSSGYASSGTSSGSSSSGGSSPPPPPPPPPPPTPFAGLPNIGGNTCYANAVLQIIAALYRDEVKNDHLKNLIDKINTSSKPLSSDELKALVSSFPNEAKKMIESSQQQDPDEFIIALNGKGFLHPIHYTDNLLFKRENDQAIFQKHLPKSTIYALQIGFNQESTSQINLSEMIASGREELVEDTGIEARLWDDYLSYNGARSSFLQGHESRLTPQEKYSLKQYIRQQVIDTIPSKLYIQLNRFSSSSNKITDKVNGTMHITIQLDPNKQDTVSFDLKGFIIHNGSSLQSGHYVAYVKREGKWYQANDTVITEVQQPQAIDQSKEAYLLFYTKK